VGVIDEVAFLEDDCGSSYHFARPIVKSNFVFKGSNWEVRVRRKISKENIDTIPASKVRISVSVFD